MALPETTRHRIEEQLNAYCVRKVRVQYRNQLRLNYQLQDDSITLFVERKTFGQTNNWASSPIAQFRYAPESSSWMIFCADREGWYPYRHAEPAKDIGALFHALDTDTTGIFWA